MRARDRRACDRTARSVSCVCLLRVSDWWDVLSIKAVLSEEHEKAVDWFDRLTEIKRACKSGFRILYVHNVQGSGWHPKRV